MNEKIEAGGDFPSGDSDDQSRLIRKTLSKIRSTPDPCIRFKIIRALSRLHLHWVDDVLLESLNDPSEKIRDCLIRELGARRELDLERVYRRMSAPPWYRKSSCLRILGLRKDPNSVRRIEALLEDPNADVKRTAADALGEIGGRESLALLARLVRDDNRFVKTAAEKALLKASDIKFS